MVVIGLITAVAAVWFYRYPEQFQSLLEYTSSGGGEVTTVYKWQNAKGEWQLSDSPPPHGIAFEILKHDTNTNVMPLFHDKDAP